MHDKIFNNSLSDYTYNNSLTNIECNNSYYYQFNFMPPRQSDNRWNLFSWGQPNYQVPVHYETNPLPLLPDLYLPPPQHSQGHTVSLSPFDGLGSVFDMPYLPPPQHSQGHTVPLSPFDGLGSVFDMPFLPPPQHSQGHTVSLSSFDGLGSVFYAPTQEKPNKDNNKKTNNNNNKDNNKKTNNNNNKDNSTDEINQTPKPTGNAPKMTYDSKPKAGNISTDGADYIVVIRSLGREQKKLDKDYFDSSGGTVVGTTGSKDKAMQLIDVRNVGSINLSDTNGTQIIKVDTGGRALKLDNATSGSNPMNGALDPMLKNEIGSIKRDAGSDFAIYGDDESKFDGRVADLKAGSSTSFYSGDDSAYVLTSTTPVDERGNGAIMQLSYA